VNAINTNIGASGLTFQSISANGAANGIVLNNTGSLAGLTVTGTGAVGSGGTIQAIGQRGVSLINGVNLSLSYINFTNACTTNGAVASANGVVTGDITLRNGVLYLKNASNINLNNVIIDGSAQDAIVGNVVNGLSILNSQLKNSGNEVDENIISIKDLHGACFITNSTLFNAATNAISVNNTQGSLTWTITGSTFNQNSAAVGNNGLLIQNSASSTIILNIATSSFKNFLSNGIGIIAGNGPGGEPQFTTVIDNCDFDNNNMGLALASDYNADLTYTLTNNEVYRSRTNAIQFLAGINSSASSHARGKIANNIIGDGTVNSGARDGLGIGIEHNNLVDGIVEITSNTIRNTDQDGIFVQARKVDVNGISPAGVSRTDITIKNNTVATPEDNTAFPFFTVYGIRVEARHGIAVYLDMAGNTAKSLGVENIRLRQRDNSPFYLERFTGTGNSEASVESYIISENPGNTADATLITTFTGIANGTTRKF
jgi:hypothetical protein